MEIAIITKFDGRLFLFLFLVHTEHQIINMK